MKVRLGFVSNSSSSSFIIAHNGSKKELKQKLKEVFDVIPNDYPIKMPKGIAECIYKNIQEDYKTVAKWFEEWGIDEVDDPKDLDDETRMLYEYLDNGWIVYTGGFDDQDDPLDYFLCNSDIYYKDKNFYISQSAGY